MITNLHWLARLVITVFPYLVICILAVVVLIYVIMWYGRIERHHLLKRRSPK